MLLCDTVTVRYDGVFRATRSKAQGYGGLVRGRAILHLERHTTLW